MSLPLTGHDKKKRLDQQLMRQIAQHHGERLSYDEIVVFIYISY